MINHWVYTPLYSSLCGNGLSVINLLLWTWMCKDLWTVCSRGSFSYVLRSRVLGLHINSVFNFLTNCCLIKLYHLTPSPVLQYSTLSQPHNLKRCIIFNVCMPHTCALELELQRLLVDGNAGNDRRSSAGAQCSSLWATLLDPHQPPTLLLLPTAVQWVSIGIVTANSALHSLGGFWNWAFCVFSLEKCLFPPCPCSFG